MAFVLSWEYSRDLVRAYQPENSPRILTPRQSRNRSSLVNSRSRPVAINAVSGLVRVVCESINGSVFRAIKKRDGRFSRTENSISHGEPSARTDCSGANGRDTNFQLRRRGNRCGYRTSAVKCSNRKTIIGRIIILITDGGQTREAGMCWRAYDSKYIQGAYVRNTYARGCVVLGT